MKTIENELVKEKVIFKQNDATIKKKNSTNEFFYHLSRESRIPLVSDCFFHFGNCDRISVTRRYFSFEITYLSIQHNDLSASINKSENHYTTLMTKSKISTRIFWLEKHKNAMPYQQSSSDFCTLCSTADTRWR